MQPWIGKPYGFNLSMPSTCHTKFGPYEHSTDVGPTRYGNTCNQPYNHNFFAVNILFSVAEIGLVLEMKEVSWLHTWFRNTSKTWLPSLTRLANLGTNMWWCIFSRLHRVLYPKRVPEPCSSSYILILNSYLHHSLLHLTFMAAIVLSITAWVTGTYLLRSKLRRILCSCLKERDTPWTTYKKLRISL